MKGKKGRMIPLIGLSFMTLSAGTFTWYEWFGGREYINYEDVLVFQEEVNIGQKINLDQLTYIKVEKDQVIKNAITVPSELEGQVATSYIPANQQLHPNFFEDASLVLKKNQYIAQIPVEWTLSVPDSMRRGDQILIYSVKYDKLVMNTLVTTQNKASSEEKIDKDAQAQEETTETTITTELVDDLIANHGLNELVKTTVAYVKDSANREVINVGDEDRINATASIHAVEIVTTTEEFKKIEEQIKLGGKLIIMYTNAQKKEEK